LPLNCRHLGRIVITTAGLAQNAEASCTHCAGLPGFRLLGLHLFHIPKILNAQVKGRIIKDVCLHYQCSIGGTLPLLLPQVWYSVSEDVCWYSASEDVYVGTRLPRWYSRKQLGLVPGTRMILWTGTRYSEIYRVPTPRPLPTGVHTDHQVSTPTIQTPLLLGCAVHPFSLYFRIDHHYLSFDEPYVESLQSCCTKKSSGS